MITTEAFPPSAVAAKTSGAIFAAIPAADDHAIIARSTPEKQTAKLMARRGAKKPLVVVGRFIGSA
jgi:hypothetical protein